VIPRENTLNKYSIMSSTRKSPRKKPKSKVSKATEETTCPPLDKLVKLSDDLFITVA
jgi:hypothetical protein